jgi:hypothetical protein
MSTQILGWLFVVPPTFSISFFPANTDSAQAELLPWPALLSDANRLSELADALSFVVIHVPPPCLCFCIDNSLCDLKDWFEKSFEIIDLSELQETVVSS